MKFESFYSSSRANLYVVTASNGQRLLIECGCTWKKLLEALNYDLSNIAGCLLSHEHKDHSKAVEDVLENGIDVYASHGTFEALGVVHRRAVRIHDKETCIISPDFSCFPFNVLHDATEPMGFIIKSDNERLLFATDTSHIKQRFGLAFTTIALSCSYDADVLHKREADGDINTELAKRLLASHMEKQAAMDYIDKYCNLSKLTEIHLLHLSRSNIDAEKTRKEFEDKFFVKTLIAGK